MTSECDPCRKDISKEAHLKMHMKKLHEVESKRIELEKKINLQKSNLMSDIYKVKKKEVFSDYKCNCKSFCRIFHNKHNWKKSACQDLSEKLTILIFNNSCNPCDKTFASEDNVIAHKSSEHDDNFEASTANSKAEEKKMGVIVRNPSIPSRGRLL